jgi:hypothetical protein
MTELEPTPERTRRIEDVAAYIRSVDGDNSRSAAALGRLIGWRVADECDVQEMGARIALVDAVIAFVERINPEQRMGAGALAELIVAEFGLDGVS